MTKKQSIYLGAALCLMLLLFSCSPRHRIFHTGNKVFKDPKIVHGTLLNGFQYILVPNQTPRERVNMHLNVFAGSMHETDNQQGLAHYLEHMLFNGSEHFKPGELIKYFQKIGMDFGADANAHTSFFNTVYDLSLPKGEHEDIWDALTVILDYAKGALLIPEEIERERGIILAEKQDRDSVSYRTFKEELSFELPGSRFCKRFPIGIESVIKNARQQDLKLFYDQWYRPDNMVLIVVGQFDTASTRKMIKDRFSKLSYRAVRGRYNENLTQWKPHNGLKSFYHYEPEDGKTQISIETVEWEPFVEQTEASLKEQIQRNLGCAMVQNRLERMIRNQETGFSDAAIYAGKYMRHLKLTTITADCKAENWDRSLQQIENILRQALEFGFSENEFKRVKADYLSMLESAVKQEKTEKSSDIARELIFKINNKKMVLSAEQKKSLLEPYVNKLTAAEVHKALIKAWAPSHRLIMVSGNAQIEHTSPQNQILSAYKAANRRTLSAYQEAASKAFPYLAIPHTSENEVQNFRQDIEGLAISSIAFKNNIHLYFKNTQFKQNQFSFRLSFGPGKFCEPVNKPGLALFSQDVIRQSGLGQLTQDQLDKALSGLDIEFGFSVKDHSFCFSGSSDPAHAQKVFQLIHHFLVDPGIRQKAALLAKTRYRQQYDQLARTVDGIMQIKGDRFFGGGDKRFGLPAPDNYAALQISDIKEWLLPYFKSAPVEISFVGDIDLSVFKDLAARYFAGMPMREAFTPGTVKMHEKIKFPKGQKLNFYVKTRIESGLLRLGFPTDDFWDISKTRRFSILSRVISERLRVSIRENLGMAYSPFAYHDASSLYQDSGIMNLYVSAKPEQLETVYREIENIILDLYRHGIKTEEMDLVLKPVVNHIKTIKRTNMYWLESVLSDVSKYPVKLQWAKSMQNDYSSIKASDLNLLVEKYMIMKDSAVIFVRPEE